MARQLFTIERFQENIRVSKNFRYSTKNPIRNKKELSNMEEKRFIFFIATVILSLTVSSYGNPSVNLHSGNKSHNFSTGVRHWDDKLLFKTNVIEPSKLLRKVVVERTFNVTGYISEVAAYDHKNDGTGAHVALLAGGPQARYVTLRFKSERGHGINFDVEIYGTHYPRY